MVEFGFYALSLAMFVSILLMILKSSGTGQSIKRRTITAFVAWSTIWIIYITLISELGILRNFELPPRVPLLVVLPAMISIFYFVSRKPTLQVIATTSKTFPVHIQSFRIIVELLIYGAFLTGAFPQPVTFEGTNFDIFVGLSAPIAGFLYSRKILADRGLLIWNFASLAILAYTVKTFISTFYFSGLIDPENTQFGNMPFTLLASVLLPCAVFYHVVSIRQMLSLKIN